MLEQIDSFLNDKEFVNMSSYKTDAKIGKPIKYLQDTKKALWKRFAEEYPNGMRHTSFMTCLEEYSKELEVIASGVKVYNSCISYCIRHAFGDCNLNHPVTCSKCESLFSFFEELKAAISEEYFNILDEYLQKLIA
ncbi:hypothetical protein GLOIN_2v326913 [Rhizophagus clarus]|uniref:Uncharacterized protein n=1 Tax=Rhizophagus clarus TaxID=94130 RepID=A0A8H3MH55_9GLOM|nr:hypothetical protein GLOIN_2v326913 [Rhizophagus clarus]